VIESLVERLVLQLFLLLERVVIVELITFIPTEMVLILWSGKCILVLIGFLLLETGMLILLL